jgi:hypothetical protein
MLVRSRARLCEFIRLDASWAPGRFAKKQQIKIIDPARDIAEAGGELKAKNIPVILSEVLALPEQENDPYDGAFTQPAEAYQAGHRPSAR